MDNCFSISVGFGIKWLKGEIMRGEMFYLAEYQGISSWPLKNYLWVICLAVTLLDTVGRALNTPKVKAEKELIQEIKPIPIFKSNPSRQMGTTS